MIYFALWVVLILLAIVSIPIASWLDSRKLQAAFQADSSYDDGGGDVALEEADAGDAPAAVEETAPTFETIPDGDESRAWDILEGLSGEEMVAQHPDFDIAYLQAAYPAGGADHESANPSLLRNGVQAAVRKSWLLGRLSSYWLAKGDPEKAFQYGVTSVLSAADVSAADVSAAIRLLQPVFAATKHPVIAAKLQSLVGDSDDSPETEKARKKAVKKLASRRNKATVAEAAEMLLNKGL